MLMIEVESMQPASALRKLIAIQATHPRGGSFFLYRGSILDRPDRILQVQVNAVKPEKAGKKKR